MRSMGFGGMAQPMSRGEFQQIVRLTDWSLKLSKIFRKFRLQTCFAFNKSEKKWLNNGIKILSGTIFKQKNGSWYYRLRRLQHF